MATLEGRALREEELGFSGGSLVVGGAGNEVGVRSERGPRLSLKKLRWM